MALVVLACAATSAQTIPPVGTAATFDVATWNIEYFGEDGGDGNEKGPPFVAQLQNVHAVISQADIDLWAIQEIASPGTNADPMEPVTWEELLLDLADDGYEGVLAPTLVGSVIRNGFIYNAEVFSDVSVSAPIAQTQYFGAKAPFEIAATVTVGGESRTIRMITFHAVSSDTQNAHQNRTTAAGLLKDYVDGLLDAGEEVILLGDFNDFLTKARWPGLPDDAEPPASPYAPFLNDSDYVAPTLPLEANGIPTFCKVNTASDPCGGELTIDHIVQSATFPEPLVVRRYERVLTSLRRFAYTTSDHAPVYARYDLSGGASLGADVPGDGSRLDAPARLLGSSPNPFRRSTDLRFALESASPVRLEVFDVRGRTVLDVEAFYSAGAHAVTLDGSALAPGPYVVRLLAGDTARSLLVVRAD